MLMPGANARIQSMFRPRNPTKTLAARGGARFSLPPGRQAGVFSTLLGWAFRPRNFMKNRMLAVGQAVSPANRPEGRLPSSRPRGFPPLSPCFPPVAGVSATLLSLDNHPNSQAPIC
jgi:hypothetical protein